jgi:hypothetical protein
VLYSIPVATYAYIFGARLPDGYRTDTKSDCQLQVEAVIDTFTIAGE